jgi:hypothetical protein
MKIPIIVLLVGLGLTATPVFAQKVVLDYAHDFDFKSTKTFQYVDTKDTNIQDSLMADRVVSAVKKELSTHGLREVQDAPDLLVTYHFSTQDNQVFQTTSMGMGRAGMGAGWGRWGAPGMGMGMGTSTTRATTFTEGTLVIDLYDPDEEKLVWRGSGTVTLKGKPEAQMKQVDKVLKKLGSRWDKIVAGKGK